MKIQTAPALAGSFLVLFALVLLGAFLTTDRDLVRTLSQGVLSIVIGIAGYYFGSSAGSRSKDDAIAAAMTAPPRAPPEEPLPSSTGAGR